MREQLSWRNLDFKLEPGPDPLGDKKTSDRVTIGRALIARAGESAQVVVKWSQTNLKPPHLTGGPRQA